MSASDLAMQPPPLPNMNLQHEAATAMTQTVWSKEGWYGSQTTCELAE